MSGQDSRAGELSDSDAVRQLVQEAAVDAHAVSTCVGVVNSLPPGADVEVKYDPTVGETDYDPHVGHTRN